MIVAAPIPAGLPRHVDAELTWEVMEEWARQHHKRCRRRMCGRPNRRPERRGTGRAQAVPIAEFRRRLLLFRAANAAAALAAVAVLALTVVVMVHALVG